MLSFVCRGDWLQKKQTEGIFKTQHVNNIGGWRGIFKVRATPKQKDPTQSPNIASLNSPESIFYTHIFPLKRILLLGLLGTATLWWRLSLPKLEIGTMCTMF